MRYAFAPVALAALAAASPMPQGVTQDISPDGATPSGCEKSYDGTFNIQIVNVSSTSTKRSVHKRQANTLAITLDNGKLTDSEGRTGYIAANNQFQFDSPPQAGAKYTSGWSVCQNEHLTLGSDDTFYSCLSGNFYNLYDENQAAQCNKVYIMAIGGGSGGSAGAQPDGQATGSAVAPATQISDGQIQATSAVAPVSQITDGQIQATSAVAPVSQISDGQIQATSAVSPISQISDGQIQAPTSAGAVTQISDGQIQAPTSVAPVTQISDGQIQAPTSAVSPVTQISDGQIQAPTGSGYAPANGTMAYPSMPVQSVAGAASNYVAGGMGIFAAIFGVAML